MNDSSPSQPGTVDSTPPAPADTDATPRRGSATDPGGPPDAGTVAFVGEAAGADSVSSLPMIPGYELLGVLGHGGMGAVYKARETALDRLVALKVIVSGSHASPEQLARFRAEARAEARLHHPHIVQVHAVGECGGLPFLSLEYLDGGTLAQKIARQPQPPRAAAELLLAIAAGSTAFAVVLDRRNGEIEQARRHGERQAEIAHTHEEIARKNAELAREEQARAGASAREAFQRYQLLYDTLVVVIEQVQHGLQTVPGTAQVRREILESAMRVLQRSIAQAGDSTRQPERSLASAHMMMGDLLLEQNKRDEARQHFDRCHAILEQLHRADPDNDKAAGNYALSLSRQGDLILPFRNDVNGALALYAQATRVQEHSLAHRSARPELRTAELHRHLATAHKGAGEILLRARPQATGEIREHLEKAREEFEKALPEENILYTRRGLEWVCLQLGTLYERLDRPDEALRAFDRCLEMRRKLAEEFPADNNRRLELVRLGAQIGDKHLFAGRTRTAERYYREAVTINERLARRDQNPNTRLLLSLNYYRLATAFLRLGERGRADEHYRKCLGLRLPLQRQFPDHLGLKIDVMIVQGRCGQHREAAAFAGELRRRFADKPEYLLHAACGYALAAFTLTPSRPDAELTEAERRLRQEYLDGAVEALRQARARGYTDLKNLQTEPDLDPVRAERGFQMLLAEYALP